MRSATGNPDTMPPGLRRILYAAFCWAIRNPMFLRRFGAVLRWSPSLAGRLGFAARATAVRTVLKRPQSFSNGGHKPNLVAGDYLIAMDPGRVYNEDRKLLDQRLTGLKVQPLADEEARNRVAQLKQRAGESFDLIDDYLMWVAFRAIQPIFGSAGSKVAAGVDGDENDQGLQRQYLLEIRYVAAQLLGGSLAPLNIQRRAELNGNSLRARMRGLNSEIRSAWNTSIPDGDLERNAVGMSWVSHPVTVQSGALVVQELLGRRDDYRRLRAMATEVGETGVWTEEKFRNCVWEHVLELMRFRPVFPVIAREVPRDTEFETGGRFNANPRAGGQVKLVSIAALFDPRAVPDSSRFCPHRAWGNEEPLRWLMFGYGSRQCPAKEHAVDILTSAVIGLLTMPELQLAHDDGKAIEYDGPLMSRMRVHAVPAGVKERS